MPLRCGPAHDGRGLNQNGPGPEFRSSFHEMDPSVGPAHERGQLFELFRMLAKLQGALAAVRR